MKRKRANRAEVADEIRRTVGIAGGNSSPRQDRGLTARELRLAAAWIRIASDLHPEPIRVRKA